MSRGGKSSKVIGNYFYGYAPSTREFPQPPQINSPSKVRSDGWSGKPAVSAYFMINLAVSTNIVEFRRSQFIVAKTVTNMTIIDNEPAICRVFFTDQPPFE